MPNYKEMYLILFNETTNAISALQKAQQKAEEAYITSDAAGSLTVINSNTDNGKERKNRPPQRSFCGGCMIAWNQNNENKQANLRFLGS